MHIISAAAPDATAQAIAVLQAGGLVIAPSETVYGVLVDVENETAVSKLLRYKRRPSGKAISIAVASPAMAEKYVKINAQARQLYQTFLPGPVTIISTSRQRADKRLESEFGTLGVRLPDYALWQQIITGLKRPTTATSANSSGRKTPYAIDDILDNLSDRQKGEIDLILDAGRLPKNPPSLVIDTTASTPIVMRSNPQIVDFSSNETSSFISRSLDESCQLAGKILLPYWQTICQKGLLISLDGDLGAGKTAFTQGIAQFLGIKEPVTSPTYTYLKEYSYQKFDQQGTLYHLDVWAIDQSAMWTTLEVEKLCHPGQLVVIEWYEQVAKFWTAPVPRLAIHLSSDPQDETWRKISVTPPGKI